MQALINFLARFADLVNNTFKVSITGSLAKLPVEVDPQIPSPETLKVVLSEATGYVVKWIDKNGYLYATQSASEIRKSIDYGVNWTVLFTIPDTVTLGTFWGGMLLVTDTGRIIAATDKGNVYVSDEAQSSFAIVFQFTTGFGSVHFGHGTYENLVWVGEYSGGGLDGKDIYLSKDYGANFTKAYTLPKISTGIQVHVHDIQYDAYVKRFWMVIGDGANAQTLYSDDYMTTWVAIYGDHAVDSRNTQFTSIAVFHHGVVFGTDTGSGEAPDGLFYWKRPEGILRPSVDPNDIKQIFKFDNQISLRVWAEKSIRYTINGKTITFMSWYGIGSNCPCLLATIDGLKWFEVWRSQTTTETQFRVIGGHFEDEELRIFGHLYDENISPRYKTFTAYLPLINDVIEPEPKPTVIQKKIVSLAKFDNISIEPSATKILLNKSVDLSEYDWIMVGVAPQASHTWRVYADIYGSGIPLAYADTVIASATQGNRASGRISLKTDSVLIVLQNQDATAKIYTHVEVFAGY